MAFEKLKAALARRRMERHIMRLDTDSVHTDYGPMRLLYPNGMTDDFRRELRLSEKRIRRAVRRARSDYDGQTLAAVENHDGFLDAALDDEIARLREKWLEIERDRAEVRLRIKAELARLQAERRRLVSDLGRAQREYQHYLGAGRRQRRRGGTEQDGNPSETA